MIKPLLVYFKAAIYPDILNELKKIPCDKLILEYYPYPHPHDIARDFFLEHTEYTHLIIHPQDLLVTREDYDNLIFDLIENDYPVLSGVCNVERPPHRLSGVMNCCIKCPNRNRDNRKYNWIPFASMPNSLGLMKVGFMGFAFTFIKRNVIERRLIDGEFIFKGCDGKEIYPDLNFCNGCKELDIPIIVDTHVQLVHYANHKPSLIGKQSCKQLFIRYEENLIHG